jgi:hypothetical protein
MAWLNIQVLGSSFLKAPVNPQQQLDGSDRKASVAIVDFGPFNEKFFVC